ncbi:MAG: 6-phosphogluconolactonase [Bifidobacterium sp.]
MSVTEGVAAASPEQTDAVLAEAAAQYQRELIEQLGENPALDIAMFGMGPDAHFASPVPRPWRVGDRRSACACRRCARFTEAAATALTLTVPMIARSKHTWVFTSEVRKADAVAAAFAQRNNPHAPSSMPMVRNCCGLSTKVPPPDCDARTGTMESR